MRKWLVRFLILAVVVALVFVLRITVFQPDPVKVVAVPAERGWVESTVTNSKAGTVKARQRASLSPETGGLVVEILRRKGERVKACEVLLRLNDAIPKAQVSHAKRALEAAEARSRESCIAAKRARQELNRHRTLVKKRLEPKDLLDQYVSNADLADAACTASLADVAKAQAAVTVAEADLARTVVRAPFEGVVAELKVEVGEWITPAPPLIQVPTVVDVLNLDSLYMSAPMDEVDSARIKVGQKVWVTLDPFPGRRFKGRVVRVAPYVLDVEAQNRTVEIEVELEDRVFASSLLPGTSVDVEVILDVRESVLRIPAEALLEGNKVLVVENGVLVERTLKTGLRNWNFVEVVEGLSVGEQVVTSLDRAEVKAGVEVVVREKARR